MIGRFGHGVISRERKVLPHILGVASEGRGAIEESERGIPRVGHRGFNYADPGFPAGDDHSPRELELAFDAGHKQSPSFDLIRRAILIFWKKDSIHSWERTIANRRVVNDRSPIKKNVDQSSRSAFRESGHVYIVN
jgi:hypothetical protein